MALRRPFWDPVDPAQLQPGC